jgi:hypothetical protein
MDSQVGGSVRITLRFKGGAGSGHFGHHGRPGNIGDNFCGCVQGISPVLSNFSSE